MKPRRRLGFVFGFFSILFLVVVWLVLHSLSLTGDECRVEAFRAYKPTGQILKIAELAGDQRIEITRIHFGDRRDDAYTLIITGGASGRLLAIQRSVAFQKDWGLVAGDFGGSAFREISMEQKRGLDTLLCFNRIQTDTKAHYYDTYEIEYFSGDRKIGSEKWVVYGRIVSFYERYEYEDLPVGMRTFFASDDWRALQSVCALLNELEEQARRPK